MADSFHEDSVVAMHTNRESSNTTRSQNAMLLELNKLDALNSRRKPTQFRPLLNPFNELLGDEYLFLTRKLYQISPCFGSASLGANAFILNVNHDEGLTRIHLVDFGIGLENQYEDLLQMMPTLPNPAIQLKITALTSPIDGAAEQRLHDLAGKLGITFTLSVKTFNSLEELTREFLEIQPEETFVINFGFKLHSLPDISRDQFLRRARSLSPSLMTILQEELNAHTASLNLRVENNRIFYLPLLETLDVATVCMTEEEKKLIVRIKDVLHRRSVNSISCEGNDRLERCESFSQWEDQIWKAGFCIQRVFPYILDTCQRKLPRPVGENGFFVNGGCDGELCIGWKGRMLAVVSAWQCR